MPFLKILPVLLQFFIFSVVFSCILQPKNVLVFLCFYQSSEIQGGILLQDIEDANVARQVAKLSRTFHDLELNLQIRPDVYSTGWNLSKV